MRKNKKDKIMVGEYKETRREKRLNGKSFKTTKLRLHPIAAIFTLAILVGLTLIAAFSMPPSYNSITYSRFITQGTKAAHSLPPQNEAESREYKAMAVIETNSGRILSSYMENEKLPMASTTKIMTAIVAIEKSSDLDTKKEVPVSAVGVEGSSMYLRKGEQFSIRELLYGLMLPSGNDAATALSILISGSENAFVQEMNNKAAQLGLSSTSFCNPHGLHAEGHHTTALDLARLTAYCMKNETFREIVGTEEYKIEESSTNKLRVFKNKQKLMKDNTLKENGIKVTGVKTGFTPEAGRCLVTSASTESGMELVTVVLNAPKMFESTAEVLKEVNKNYEMHTILEPKEHISSISVVGSKKEDVKIYHNGALSLPLTKKEKAEIKINYTYPELLVAPVYKEQKVGEVSVLLNGEVIYNAPIQTLEEAKNITIFSIIKDVIQKF